MIIFILATLKIIIRFFLQLFFFASRLVFADNNINFVLKSKIQYFRQSLKFFFEKTLKILETL